MSDFVNTIDLLGDEAVMDSIIDRSITEFKDNKVTSIGQYAFYGCASLKNVELPNVKTFSRCAFEKCTALEKADLQNATYLDWSVFADCTSLSEINIPNVTGVGCNTFNNVPITKLILPKIETISQSNYATGLGFMPNLETLDIHKKCTHYSSKINGLYPRLKNLIFRTENDVCIFASAWGNYNVDWSTSLFGTGTGHIYVPLAMLDAYIAQDCWSALSKQFRALENYTVDGTITGELDESKI